MKKSELLLPVGNLQMCLAAIHNGADAVYMGMPHFNARGRSQDFKFEDLKEMIDLCHLYGVKVHIAFNILIFQDELQDAYQGLQKLLPLGPDAIIVQDLGLVKMIKQMCPDQVVHASTQMTVTNHEAIELLDDLQMQRFVLGRENSLDEIAIIRKHTQKELEVFVHGALCVAYSGQCFTSESLGGRSANRGQCAQSCRFDYTMLVDGKKRELGNLKYLVSPKDLCGVEEVPRLQEIGVESFKVEGRLKGPEYVASVARNYRRAIDGDSKLNFESAKNEMALTYSRGFYSGWLHSVAHQKLVDGTYGSHRGLFLGKVKSVDGRWIALENPSCELIAGDGVLFVSADQHVGGKVFQVQNKGSMVLLSMSNDFNLKAVTAGTSIYLNRKESLSKELNQSYENREKLKRIPIKLELILEVGKPAQLHVTDGTNSLVLLSEQEVQSAINRSMGQEEIEKHLTSLGQTAYRCSHLTVKQPAPAFLPNSELKYLKRKLVEELNASRVEVRRQLIPWQIPERETNKTSQVRNGKLNVLFRNIEQLQTAMEFLHNSKYREFIGTVILDYEFGKDYLRSVEMVKAAGFESAIATTRILKPTEYHNFRLIERSDPDAILVRNLGALNYFRNSKFKLLGDFSLNCSNSISFEYLMQKGLSSLCASYDLNAKQLMSLVSNVDASKLEITVHQHMPEFHMEHCVFAAFLSKGNSFRDCGKPCEKHRVQLKDMYGNMHELKADQECRNTMFKSEALSAVDLIPSLLAAGVSQYRFEALHDNPQELIQKLDLYLRYVSGEIEVQGLKGQLEELVRYGVGSGQYFNDRQYQDRKKN